MKNPLESGLLSYIHHKILRAPIKLPMYHESDRKNYSVTVVFLHGIASSARNWSVTIKELEKAEKLKGFRFISLDLLGYGQAADYTWLNYDYNDYLSSLRATLKSIGTPVILVGHSMGSLIAARYANTYPEDVLDLVLVSPPIIMPRELRSKNDDFYIKNFRKLPQSTDKPGVSAIAHFIEKITAFRSKYLTTPQFEHSMENIVLNPENYQTFLDLKTRTAIIHGKFDPLIIGENLEKVVKKNKNIDYYVCNLSRHELSIGKRRKLQKVLEELAKEYQEEYN